MVNRILKITFLITVSIFSFCNYSYAEKEKIDPNIQLSMRMIGHQVLLNAGDSSSRVLPIRKESNRYEIPFEAAFELSPDELIVIVNNVIKTIPTVDNYVVEVNNCITNEMVYSYKIGDSKASNMIPCRGRILPKDCYTIFITFLKDYEYAINLAPEYMNNPAIIPTNLKKQKSNTLLISLGIITPLLLLGFFIFSKNKLKNTKTKVAPKVEKNPNIIKIGQYFFDKITLKLSIHNKTVELSSKEADLLLLLQDNKNETLEREQILKEVWGDEGDYIGRTLDVFISKLRKRLKDDNNLKIVNVRGVGYRFVFDITPNSTKSV